jgi:hypothetical protein
MPLRHEKQSVLRAGDKLGQSTSRASLSALGRGTEGEVSPSFMRYALRCRLWLLLLDRDYRVHAARCAAWAPVNSQPSTINTRLDGPPHKAPPPALISAFSLSAFQLFSSLPQPIWSCFPSPQFCPRQPAQAAKRPGPASPQRPTRGPARAAVRSTDFAVQQEGSNYFRSTLSNSSLISLNFLS